MYQNQASNLNRITAHYGFPAKQLNDSGNISMYSNRKVGDDTFNKSQSSPKSPNTSELLIQNIGGKVSDLSKEVNRLMQMNDKLLVDIQQLNTQNQNKENTIKNLSDKLVSAESKNINGLQQNQYHNQQIFQVSNLNRNFEKEESFQMSETKSKQIGNVLSPRLGVGPYSNINNLISSIPVQNGSQNQFNEEQNNILNSLEVNSGPIDKNYLFNSNQTESQQNSAQKNEKNVNSQEKYLYNQIVTNPTSTWSPCGQDDQHPLQSQFGKAFQTLSNEKNQQQNQTNQFNQVLMLASFQDMQSNSSNQTKDLLNQIQQLQSDTNNIKQEKESLQLNFDDLKKKYEELQKEHAREIAQLKTNMFNSVVESDSGSKYDEQDDPLMKNSIHRERKDLTISIEGENHFFERNGQFFEDHKHFQQGGQKLNEAWKDDDRFKKKDNEQFICNTSFSEKKDQGYQQLQKSNLSNIHLNNNSVNLINSQEFISKSHEKIRNSQMIQNSPDNYIQSHQTSDKRDSALALKRNSVRNGTMNTINTFKDNLLDVIEQLELSKKENLQLKQELKIMKEELIFVSSKDENAHEKNKMLRIIESKLKLEQEEEIMKYKIKNEEMQSEIKKLSSLNKTFQNEVIKQKDESQSHNRFSTIIDEKTLENLFDSEIESDEDDLEDDGYGDRDSKQIRKHKNDILNTMTNNEKIYNKIIYLKRKNRRLEDQLQEWKRQYWLLEKSNQNLNNDEVNTNNGKKPSIQQQKVQKSNEDQNIQFEFNFQQYLQYQQRASMEIKKSQQTPLPINNENREYNKQSNASSFSQNKKAPSYCDTPAVRISTNYGKDENNQKLLNGNSLQIQYNTSNQNSDNQYLNHLQNQSQIQQNQQYQNQYPQHFNQIQTLSNSQKVNGESINRNQIENVNINPNNIYYNSYSNNIKNDDHINTNNIYSANFNKNIINNENKNDHSNNYNDDQNFLKETSFGNQYEHGITSIYQNEKSIPEQNIIPITQFNPQTHEESFQLQQNQNKNNNGFTSDQISKTIEEKNILEKGAKNTIKDIRDEANMLDQKRKTKNTPLFFTNQQQILTAQKNMKQPNQLSTSYHQKIMYDPFNYNSHKDKNISQDYSKQYLANSKQNGPTKISHLISNYKKFNVEKPGSPKSTQANKNLNITNTSSNNTSQTIITPITCQTDRQIVYTQQSINSQSPIGHQSQKLKTVSNISTTPRLLNAKHTTSIHQSSSKQQQQNKSMQQQHPLDHSQKNNFIEKNSRNIKNQLENTNISYLSSKQQILQTQSNNNIGKSITPLSSTKILSNKQIESSYSNNFIYQKPKLTQRQKNEVN